MLAQAGEARYPGRMSEPLRLSIDRFETPLGELAIIADDAGRLRAVEWTAQDDRMQRSLRLQYGADGFSLRRAKNPAGLSAALRAYFAGELHAIDALPVATAGTAFQQSVWRARKRLDILAE